MFCLNSFLRIFGQPIRQTNCDILTKILEIFSQNSTKSVSKGFSFYNSSEDQNNTQNETKLTENQTKRKFDSIDCRQDIEIPDEFIDKITNEIMIDPILLPSGHSVDKTTLDKYLSEESNWCRPPSDPFTQLLFTSERQPKPNHILRQRIDQFLSQMCGQSVDERLEISNKRRIVGYNYVNKTNQLTSSKLLAQKDPLQSGSQSSSSSDAKRLIDGEEVCVECRKSHSSNESTILYKLFCNHLICRTKLIEISDKKSNKVLCNECHSETPTDKIVKLNRI